MTHFIYRITNKINNKSYVGQTRQTVEKRFKEHILGTNHKSLVHKAISKYGAENFEVETLATFNNATQEEVNECEEKFMKELNTSIPHGYNIQRVVASGYKKDYKSTEETIQRLKKAGRDRHERNPEHLKSISKLGTEKLKDPEIQKLRVWMMMSKKKYILTKPDGSQICTYGLSHLTEEYGLDPSGLIKVARNKMNHHKGWRCQDLNNVERQFREYMKGKKKYEIHHESGFAFCSYGTGDVETITGCKWNSLRYSEDPRCQTKSHKGWSILAA